MDKKGSFWPIILITVLSLALAYWWDKIPFVKNAVHVALDPSAGALLIWNLNIGMLIVVFIITLITTLIQKYATDQKALKELRAEQKLLQEEMKKFKDDPARISELSKKQLEFIPRTFKLTSRTVLFTGIPFLLFFRWFYDFFAGLEQQLGHSIVFLGFLPWFWFYLIFTLIFSSILRKVMKVL